jgi:hypothetical protein
MNYLFKTFAIKSIKLRSMNIAHEELLNYKIRSYNFLRDIGQGSCAKVYEAYD